MKKIIIGLSGIVLVAFVVVMVANASGDPKETKKAATEVSKDCAKCPSAAACADKAEAKKGEASKTSDAKPCAAACKTPCSAGTEAKKCEEAKPCAASKK